MDDAPSRVFEKAGLALVYGGPRDPVAVYQLGISWITFTREPLPKRIVIVCQFGGQNENGFVGLAGFGIDWFAQAHLNPEYLCEKFLHRRWSESAAANWALYRAMDLLDEFGPALDRDPLPWIQACFTRIDEALRDHERAIELEDGSSPFATPALFADWHSRVFQGHDDPPYNAGIAYDPTDRAWLAAIQQAFAHEYAQTT